MARALRQLTLVLSLVLFPALARAQPKLQITSPKSGARISQEKPVVLVSGKVSTLPERNPNVDILFVLDTSASTAQYAGIDFSDASSRLPPEPRRWARPQIGIYGGGFGIGGGLPLHDLQSSVLAAEVAASQRLLSQLNSQTTRVGIVTFAADARLVQPLTHDFDSVKRALDDILANGPYGGTNMAAAVRLGVRELAGLGESPKRADAVKVQFFLTDGIPTLPIGGSRRAAPEDTQLAVNAARIAGKAGIKIYVFALGDEALSYPAAAVGIARESGGLFTPVVRPADILAVLEKISVVGIDHVQIINETNRQKASQMRLAADGNFSGAVPVVEGNNQIQVIARSSSGAVVQDSIAIYYERSRQQSLDLEVFLEREKSLQLQVERLGRSPEALQGEIERARDESLRKVEQPPPPAREGPPR
ncbi:MAG TPA: VWA domain-containing protein [Candidatus Acidoferrales bacterium]|nr:VWA domain-containing protein [Candidatus Acidoferrales bacterium]